MRFTLHYRGRLKANGSPQDKHTIRRHIHSQLKCLWQQKPLVGYTRLLEPDVGELCVLRKRHGFDFAPLVAESISLVAELDILMLWPSSPGHIITSGGDIDNRLKTLLDALKVPTEPTALPRGAAPAEDEKPFFCLLEDDSLITRIGVETDRLLVPVDHASIVDVTMRVTTRQLSVHVLTLGLA